MQVCALKNPILGNTRSSIYNTGFERGKRTHSVEHKERMGENEWVQNKKKKQCEMGTKKSEKGAWESIHSRDL